MSNDIERDPRAQVPPWVHELIPCAQQQIRDVDRMLAALPPHHRKRMRDLLSESFREALDVIEKAR